MGDTSAVPGHVDDDDPDAPWRRGFDGWDARADDPAAARSGGSLVRRTDDDGADAGEVWSREHDQRPKEPWVPEPRAPRARPAPTTPASAPVAEVEGQPPSASTGDVVLAAMAVFVVLALAVGAAVVLRPSGSDADAGRTLPLIAETVERRWEHSVVGAIDDVGIGAELIAVASGGAIAGLDALTGAERWTAAVDGDVDRVTVFDQHVIVELRAANGRAEVHSFDERTGAEVWNDTLEDGVVSVSGADDDPLLFRRVQVDGEAQIDVIDPATGAPIGEPFRLSGVTAAGDDLAVGPTERTVAIWSRRDQMVVTEPVGSFNLRMATAHEGRVVALDREGRVILFGADGSRLDETPFVSEAFGEFTNRPQLVGVVDEGPVAIVSSGSTVGYALDDESLEFAWQRDGRTTTPVSTEAGAVAMLVGPDGTSGQIRTSIIDPLDGSTLVVTDPEGNRERPPVLGHNAYVVAPTIGAARRVVEAHDYDGDLLWETEIAADESFELAHGVLVTVRRDDDRSIVSLAR